MASSVSLRIAFALAGFFPRHKAGTEMYVLHLSRYLRAQGHQVQLIIPDTSGEMQPYEYDGFPVHPFSVAPEPHAREMNGLESPRALPDFMQRVQAIKPQVVHFHSFNRAIDSRFLQAVSRLDIRTVFTAHLGGLFCARGDLRLMGRKPCDGKVKHTRCAACWMKSKGLPYPSHLFAATALYRTGLYRSLQSLAPALGYIPFKKRELRILQHYADAVVAIAPWIKETFQRNGLPQVRLVNQGIDTTLFQTQKPYQVHHPIQMIFVGRMHPVKGFDVLVEALEMLEPTYKAEVTVVTIPFTDEWEYYRSMKARFRQSKRGSWKENLAPDELKLLIEKHDLLILPSRSEVAPLSLLEANALKIPVLGSDYVAIADLVHDQQNGRLFHNGDAADLAQKLREIIRKPAQLGQWSAQIPQVRDVSDVGREMEGIYTAITH